MSRSDDLIARLNTQGMHGDVESIGAIGTGDAVRSTGQCSKLLFEAINERSTDKSRGSDDLGNCMIDIALDAEVLLVQVCEWYVH